MIKIVIRTTIINIIVLVEGKGHPSRHFGSGSPFHPTVSSFHVFRAISPSGGSIPTHNHDQMGYGFTTVFFATGPVAIFIGSL